MKKQYGSNALGAIHETACDLHDAGVMDKRTLHKFDRMCLTPGKGLNDSLQKQP